MAKASAAARASVRALIERHRRSVSRLGESEAAALDPVFRQAKRELEKQLKHWVETREDGDVRWTAHSYRVALAQINEGIEELADEVAKATSRATTKARHLAVAHSVDEIAKLSGTFKGSTTPIRLDAAKVIAHGESWIIGRVRTSTKRYAGNVGRDIKQRLAVDILKGASVSETVDRLQEHGGPRGKVALRGVAGEPGSIVENIPEGLFKRYRHWAERIVVTETTSAYGRTKQDGLKEFVKVVPGLQRKWSANAGACASVCIPMDGQVVDVGEPFVTGDGDRVQHEPAHPRCRCATLPWKASWSSLGL